MINTPNSLIGTYRRTTGQERLFAVVGIVADALVILLLYMLSTGYKLEAAGSFLCSTPFILLMAVLASIFTGFYFYKGFLEPRQTLEIYDNGFVLKRGETGTFQPWDDVAAYTHKVVKHYRYLVVQTNTDYELTLLLDDGKKIVIDHKHYGKSADLADILPRVLEKPMLKYAAEALKAGESLPFNTIEVSRKGITKGKKLLPWENVADITVKRGTLTIYEARPNGKRNVQFVSMQFGTLPNAFLLVNVVIRLAPIIKQRQINAQFVLD